MPRAYVLQDWITVSGLASADVVIQSMRDYLDVLGGIDFAFYIDVADQSGTPTITYQTGPTREENMFSTFGSQSITTTGPAASPYVKLYASASPPASRWLRWKVSSGSANWRLTFRVWVTVRTR